MDRPRKVCLNTRAIAAASVALENAMADVQSRTSNGAVTIKVTWDNGRWGNIDVAKHERLSTT